jgi:hypothetical protein
MRPTGLLRGVLGGLSLEGAGLGEGGMMGVTRRSRDVISRPDLLPNCTMSRSGIPGGGRTSLDGPVFV